MKLSHLLFLLFLLPLASFAQDDAATLTKIGDQVPQFSFETEKGKTVNISDYKGKLILINLFATWCPPCIAEMPAINKLHEKFKNDESVVFILVDADGDLKKSQVFMDRKKFGLPVYAVASEIPEQLFKGSLPTTLVFDKSGRVAYNEIGAADYSNQKFIAFIDKLKTTK